MKTDTVRHFLIEYRGFKAYTVLGRTIAEINDSIADDRDELQRKFKEWKREARQEGLDFPENNTVLEIERTVNASTPGYGERLFHDCKYLRKPITKKELIEFVKESIDTLLFVRPQTRPGEKITLEQHGEGRVRKLSRKSIDRDSEWCDLECSHILAEIEMT